MSRRFWRLLSIPSLFFSNNRRGKVTLKYFKQLSSVANALTNFFMRPNFMWRMGYVIFFMSTRGSYRMLRSLGLRLDLGLVWFYFISTISGYSITIPLYRCIYQIYRIWLGLFLWYINLWRLFNAKSIFIHINGSISNNSVYYKPSFFVYTQLNVKTVLFQTNQFSISIVLRLHTVKYQNSSMSNNSVLHKYTF